MNARHPDYGSSHIDPGDPPVRYADDLDIPKANPDPINAWQPGSVEEQRRSGTHFRPKGGPSLGSANPHARTVHVTQAEMGRMPEVGPEPDGPNYEDGVKYDPTLEIKVGIPTRERTMRILRGPAHAALLEFMRSQQGYQDADEALGAQGQFSEIYHDVAKLKRMIWDRRNPQSVAVDEVTETLKSLIGHALLTMDLIQEGNKDGRA